MRLFLLYKVSKLNRTFLNVPIFREDYTKIYSKYLLLDKKIIRSIRTDY